MFVGILFQGFGLYMFAATYYLEKMGIISLGLLARIINGVVIGIFM